MIVCKYKFDKSIYSNLIPVFNDGYTGYTISDEIDSTNSNHIIRTIECDTLPTKIDFGVGGNIEQYTNRSDSLLAIYNLDTSAMTDGNRMVKGCRYMTEINTSDWNTSSMVDMSGMFGYCTNLTSLDVSNWDTSNVTNMNAMFYGCNKLTSLDVSNWDTSKVTSMGYMFCNCINLTSLDVSNFDTSKVTDMNNMFAYCNNLTSLDVSNWDTSNVTNMNGTFYKCNKLTSLDVSNWDTTNVTDMSYMFYKCNKLTSLDVSNWDTTNVTDMSYMFYNCDKLTSLDVSNFNTSNVTNMRSMFYKCTNLTSLDVSNWDTSNVTDMSYMFVSTSLTRLDIGNWNTSKVISVAHMLYNCKSLMVLDINNFNISNLSIDNIILETSSLRYIRCNNIYTINTLTSLLPSKTSLEQGVLISDAKLSEETLTALASKNWTVVSSTKVAEYVYDSNTWNSMIPEFNDEFVEYFIDDIEDENGLVTRVISSMGELPTQMRFGGDSNIKKAKSLLKILDINTSNVTTMKTMFYNCYNLTSLDVSNWDTSNVTNMYGTFSRCYSLTSLDVSNWDTSKVTDMSYMFDCCTSLTQLDISNWDISKIASTLQMFGYCYKLTTLDISNWDISNVTDMTSMFTDTFKLTDIGMLYCSPSTINTIASNLPTTHTQTIWVKDTKPNECTVVSGVEFKEYKENSYMINLSSPLLKGDRIEVKDGKLCHYHKMGMVVLNGSENWAKYSNVGGVRLLVPEVKIYSDSLTIPNMYCDNLPVLALTPLTHVYHGISIGTSTNITMYVQNITNSDGVKQWLQANPTTVIYELANPYYEDITPLQSDIVLETYLESNLDIYTKLPIKTNVSYITNVPSLSTLSMRATEMKESDNIIANLTNMLDNEINE